MPVNVTNHTPAVDLLHGVSVSDPFRWLEERSLPETEAWIAGQQRIHDDYFARLPGMPTVRRMVRRYLDVETLEQPARVAGRYFFRRRRRGEEQACLVTREADYGGDQTLVDPSPLGPHAAVSIHRISDYGRFLAYERRMGGEKTAAIHFVEVESQRLLKDHLDTGYPRGLVFGPSETGFYYCHETPEEIRESRPHMIRHHRFGTPAVNDPVLLSVPRELRSRMLLLSDDDHLGAVICREGEGGVTVDLHRALRSDEYEWQPIFQNRPAPCAPFFRQGRIFVFSGAGGPGRISEIGEDGAEGRLVVPEWKVPVRGFQLFGDKLLVSYLDELRPIVQIWSLDGVSFGELPVPRNGSFSLQRSLAPHPESVFGTFESFSEPPSILEFDERLRGPRIWAGSTDGEHPVSVRRETYSSKDRTAIPIFLVARRTSEPSGSGPGSGSGHRPGPAILTAYGGFGRTMTPRFSVLVSIMLELGAVFALASIRGGGEFGESWHEAARGRRRQVAIDDFIAAAEWLERQKIASPERLAIFGGSNSGLLAGAAMTQRPELFRAVLMMAPILDMVRYERFGDAGKHRREYGTVEDPEDFKALHAYSPYHHVSDLVNYPATLFVTGDKDMVCDPAHTRKMAARLAARSAQLNPVLVDYTASRGHTAVLPLSMRVEALTRRIVFLCDQLGISIPAEEEAHD